jgi:hypothetical protein
MTATGHFLPRGLAAAPRWIVLITAAQLIVGLFTLALGFVTGDAALVRNFFEYPGALLLAALVAMGVALCVLVLQGFPPGEPLRPAWLLITLAATSRIVSGLFGQLLAINALLSPLSGTGEASASMGGASRHTGLPATGPIGMILFGLGFLLVLGTFRKSGIPMRLKRTDWVLLISLGAFTAYSLACAVKCVCSGDKITTFELFSLANNPLLGVLGIEAVLLWRSASYMGCGLIAKCWRAFSVAIFLSLADGLGVWVADRGYLPWPASPLTWFLWFPAAAAYALAPAYQVAAMCRAATRTSQAGRDVHRLADRRLGDAPAV